MATRVLGISSSQETTKEWDVETLVEMGYRSIKPREENRDCLQEILQRVESIKKFFKEIASEIDPYKLSFFIYHVESDTYYRNKDARLFTPKETIAGSYTYILMDNLKDDEYCAIRSATAAVVAIGYERLHCNGTDWCITREFLGQSLSPKIDLSLKPRHLKSTVTDTTNSKKRSSSTLTYGFYLALQSIKTDRILKDDNAKVLLLLRIWMKAVMSLKRKEEQTSSAFANRTVEIAGKENLTQSSIQVKEALISAWKEVGLLPKASSPTFIRKHKMTIGWLVVAATALIVFRFVFRR